MRILLLFQKRWEPCEGSEQRRAMSGLGEQTERDQEQKQGGQVGGDCNGPGKRQW